MEIIYFIIAKQSQIIRVRRFSYDMNQFLDDRDCGTTKQEGGDFMTPIISHLKKMLLKT